MMGLRLQGLKVLRVVVHVGDGVFFALIVLPLVVDLRASWEYRRDHAEAERRCKDGGEVHGGDVIVDYCAMGLVVRCVGDVGRNTCRNERKGAYIPERKSLVVLITLAQRLMALM